MLAYLHPAPGETVLDATLGLGGHASVFAEAVGPKGKLIALDADESNIALARETLKPYVDRVAIYHRNFSGITGLLPLTVDVLFADLGVSSPHLDDPERGFTFRADAPLDMRYDRTRGKTAADFLREAEFGEIADVLRRYGEVAMPGRLANALHERFSGDGPQTTAEAKAAVESVVGYRAPSILPQVFQALRIRVNDELGALEALLAAIPELMAPGGRCGIISYHSLEDRLVKHAFRALTTPVKDETTGQIAAAAPFELLTRKAVVPSDEEIAVNPRARSAKFRVIRRTNDPSSD